MMCVWSDIPGVQDSEMYYMNAWLKRCVFNLDLNRESVSELQTLGYSRVWEPKIYSAVTVNWSNMIIFSWPGKDSSRSILYYL